MSTLITSTLTLIYLPLLLATTCPVTNNYYQAIDVVIYQTTTKDKTLTSFNLWSYANKTEHKFNVTITYKAGNLLLCKTIFIKSKDKYTAKNGYFIFTRILAHKPEDTINYFVYMQCLDFECLDN